jgi:type I restriction enzyme S subunit
MFVECEINSHYYLELFKTRRMKAEFRRRSSGLGTGEAGFMRLQYGNFGQIPMPVPPRPEQEAIVREIETKTLANGTLIQRTQQEIRLLEEFRARLTSDVVTGQVDVREVAGALPPLKLEAGLAAVDEAAGADDDTADVAGAGMEDE